MTFLNHYQKTTFIFMLMVRVFFYQDKNVHKIEDVLNKEFLTLCDWFVDQFILGKMK